MKYAILVLVSLVSTTAAFADGFRCEGQGYRVKMYNHVRAEDGTRNPAVMIVSLEGRGTLAVLDASEIEKSHTSDSTVIYEGQTHGSRDGRFVSAELEVFKDAWKTGANAGLHEGTLRYSANGESVEVTVLCERYRKADRR